MSLDRSLKSANALVRHRNVLTRAERLAKLEEEEKWSQGRNSVFGLPKVAHRKLETGKGAAKAEEAAEGAATTTAGAAPAAAGKSAPAAAAGAKGAAAPSAGGKATAPAAGKAPPAPKKK